MILGKPKPTSKALVGKNRVEFLKQFNRICDNYETIYLSEAERHTLRDNIPFLHPDMTNYLNGDLESFKQYRREEDFNEQGK